MEETDNRPVVTRFAPSPTGMLHIGGLRTTLFSWLWARKNKGQFILRLEDTDRTRLVEGAAGQIMQSISDLGMDWDYGPDKPGPFGSTIQSERLMTYQDNIERLLASGAAYRDWRSPEELEQLRAQAQAEKRPFIYRKSMAKLSGDITEPNVIRIAIPDDKQFCWDDAVKGLQTWDSINVDDFIAIKGDGFPTYHFANICDDHAMGVTHVIRADEWLASTPKHLWLWEILGWKAPVYAHAPAVLGPDGKKKLSKRDGAKDVSEYLTEGYTPEALMNFLALIGWNDGTDKEFYTPEELIQAFSLDRIQKSPARFDPAKLEWMNGVHIRAMSPEELLKRSADWWHPAAQNFPDEYKSEVLRLNRERLKLFSELSELTWFFFKDPSPSAELKQMIKDETSLSEILVTEYLNKVIEICEHSDFSEQYLHDQIYALCEPLNTKPAVLFKLIRIGLVGGKNAPGLFETMHVLGQETTLRRLKNISKLFAAN